MNAPPVLVTGGAGFIGSHLVDALLGQGRRVRVLDNLSVGKRQNLTAHETNPNLEILVGDVADPNTAESAVAGVGQIYHLAARADIVPSIEIPETYFAANVTGTFNIMQAARQHNVAFVFYAASSSCYGLATLVPTPETAPIQPQYPYALTKALGEQIALHWGRVYAIPVTSLRFFNVFGPRARTSGTYGAVFGVFLAQILAGKPLTVVGDGRQTRDFTFVTDVVEAILLADNPRAHGLSLNVGTGNPQSVLELVRLLNAPEIVHIPKRPGEPDTTHADVSRILDVLGWQARTPFADGVRIMLENIDAWRDAPVWTRDSIEEATREWFQHLGTQEKPGT